jgi:hypothetical protein
MISKVYSPQHGNLATENLGLCSQIGWIISNERDRERERERREERERHSKEERLDKHSNRDREIESPYLAQSLHGIQLLLGMLHVAPHREARVHRVEFRAHRLDLIQRLLVLDWHLAQTANNQISRTEGTGHMISGLFLSFRSLGYLDSTALSPRYRQSRLDTKDCPLAQDNQIWPSSKADSHANLPARQANILGF